MLTQCSTADKRRVYLAWRTVFAGPNAQLRKRKKVREVIEAHQHNFKPLIKDLGFEKVFEIAIFLLNGLIFQSELKAKITFPELFRTTPSRDVQHAESENDAVRSEAEALEDLITAGEAEVKNDDCRDEDEDEEEDEDDDEDRADTKQKLIEALSLYPLYLPYKAQHVILTTVQRQLEECCFEFTAKWLPALLEDKKWDCAEAVELTKWTRMLAMRCDKIPAHAINNDSACSLEEVLFSTNILRHTAVHRLSTSAKGVLKMIKSAARLAKTLGDQPRASQLECLYSEAESRLRDMEINKNFLENRLDEQLRTISEQRAELDRKEQDAIATMLRDDQDNKMLIGSFLEASCKEAFEIADVKQDSTALIRLHTDSDDNDDDAHGSITQPEGNNEDPKAEKSLLLLNSI